MHSFLALRGTERERTWVWRPLDPADGDQQRVVAEDLAVAEPDFARGAVDGDDGAAPHVRAGHAVKPRALTVARGERREDGGREVDEAFLRRDDRRDDTVAGDALEA